MRLPAPLVGTRPQERCMLVTRGGRTGREAARALKGRRRRQWTSEVVDDDGGEVVVAEQCRDAATAVVGRALVALSRISDPI